MMLLTACTREEDSYNWEISIENTSSQDVVMSVYRDGNEFNYEYLETSILIPSGEVKVICTTTSELIGSLLLCFNEPAQYIFSFPNGRGHYCTSSIFEDPQPTCFIDGKFILDRNEYGAISEKNKNLVTYTILEEDYENAHELPD